MKQKIEKPHSADYFGEYRNHWWNLDFLELMAKRLNFDKVSKVLDIGCGIGHWGHSLSFVLPDETKIIGVDREKEWVQKATIRAQDQCEKFTYLQSDVHHLPFDDETFDMVTCQTVLIHVPDPKVVLSEMVRVLKPGGLVLVAEPNNLVNWLIMNNLSFNQNINDIINTVKFALICEHGKMKKQLGFNSVGDLIPGYFSEIGLKQIKTYISDKAQPIFRPYEGQEQQAMIKQLLEWRESECFIWGEVETKSYFLAGGGDELVFNDFWLLLKKLSSDINHSIQNGEFNTAGGGVMYLISGRK